MIFFFFFSEITATVGQYLNILTTRSSGVFGITTRQRNLILTRNLNVYIYIMVNRQFLSQTICRVINVFRFLNYESKLSNNLINIIRNI